MKIHFGKSRSGQVVVALVLMLVALIFLALVNVDVFLALRGKSRLGNAGDAAALAAARWQGITLNLIGALNLERIDAVCLNADMPEKVEEITAGILALQERIAFAGPLMGFHAANQAAKRNGAPIDPGITRLIDEAAARASGIHAPDGSFWPSKWQDYSTMLRQIRGDGLAAGCDNARLLDLTVNFHGHTLYYRGFYEAVDGEDWCWFYLNNLDSLLAHFTSWPPPPEPRPIDSDNPEFFGVLVHRSYLPIYRSRETLRLLASAYDLVNVTDDRLDDLAKISSSIANVWYTYDLDDYSGWRAWTEMDPSGPDETPVLSPPKDEYNVFGATAATRVIGELEALTPGVPEKNIVWTAAAKPFGFRDAAGFKEPVTRLDGKIFPLVTPDFSAVRLIPLAGTSEGRLGMADESWVKHVREHVQPYVETSHKAHKCRWCDILNKWDDPAFRRKGADWLKDNSDQCVVTGGHSTQKGGTRHAH